MSTQLKTGGAGYTYIQRQVNWHESFINVSSQTTLQFRITLANRGGNAFMFIITPNDGITKYTWESLNYGTSAYKDTIGNYVVGGTSVKLIDLTNNGSAQSSFTFNPNITYSLLFYNFSSPGGGTYKLEIAPDNGSFSENIRSDMYVHELST